MDNDNMRNCMHNVKRGTGIMNIESQFFFDEDTGKIMHKNNFISGSVRNN